MHTNNFHLQLMKPSQQNKEVFFNETIGVIDSFVVNSITDFVNKEPSDEFKNQKFIMLEGIYKNHICFSPFPSRKWSYMPPAFGMIYFVLALKNFVFFDGENWQTCNQAIESYAAGGSYEARREDRHERFAGVVGEITLKTQYNFLYLQENTKLMLDPMTVSIFDIVIKQNFEKLYEVSFDVPILWGSNLPYRASAESNNMDYIRLIKLPETEHYLGEIVQYGYKY